MREFLSDFGPATVLVAMALVTIWLREVNLDILNVPEKFGTARKLRLDWSTVPTTDCTKVRPITWICWSSAA